MDCDTPPPAPAAGILADMLARRAWDDDVSDGGRLLIEWAADTIRAILIANARHASRSEQLEAALHCRGRGDA